MGTVVEHSLSSFLGSSQVTWEESRESRTDCKCTISWYHAQTLIVVHPVGGIILSQPVPVAICMVVIAKKSTYYNESEGQTLFFNKAMHAKLGLEVRLKFVMQHHPIPCGFSLTTTQ